MTNSVFLHCTGTLNVPELIAGCPTQLPEYGVVWLLSSDELYKHTRQFLKECPYWVAQMSQGYEYVYNFVDQRNWKTLKWLQFLGFEVKEKIEQYGHGKLPFLLMMKEINKQKHV